MDVYYNVKFQLYITSGSKVSRGVQICTPPGIGCVQTTPRNRVKLFSNDIEEFQEFRLYFAVRPIDLS